MLCTCSMNSTGSEVHERAGADAGCAVWRVVSRVGERELLPRCRGHPNNPSLASAWACRAGWLAIGFGPVCVRAL